VTLEETMIASTRTTRQLLEGLRALHARGLPAPPGLLEDMAKTTIPQRDHLARMVALAPPVSDLTSEERRQCAREIRQLQLVHIQYRTVLDLVDAMGALGWQESTASDI
jgi:hypothetical protein